MPGVTECDDSCLYEVLAFPLRTPTSGAALDAAAAAPVDEGCVGAGTGMQCFDFKGGIGTASRVLGRGRLHGRRPRAHEPRRAGATC